MLLSSRHQLDVPSSDVFDPNDTPTLYPRVVDWLLDLDAGESGADDQYWMQYQQALDNNNGYKHITQIAEDGKHTGGVGELTDLCSMPVEIVRLLINMQLLTQRELQIRRGLLRRVVIKKLNSLSSGVRSCSSSE
jgi:hypothetical protein